MTDIIVALISGFVGLVSIVASLILGFNKMLSKLDKHNAVQEERTKYLEDKIDVMNARLDKHNNFIVRVYDLEKNESVIKEQIHNITEILKSKGA